VHPWLPQYRLEFFELITQAAPDWGFELVVLHGSPPPELAARRDSVSSSAFIEVPDRFSLGGRGAVWKDGRVIREHGPWDALVLEQAVRNIESYRWLAQRKVPVAFWGHGRTYTKQVPRAQEWLKRVLTRRTRWFFAYTDGGREHVESVGFDPSRITVVNNTIDVARLRSLLSKVQEADRQELRTNIGASGPVLTFIGGLDDSKRIDFLMDTAQELARVVPEATVVVAGAGPRQAVVQCLAEALPNLRYSPPVFGFQKAVLLSSSDYILMPGRVGLVVMDSFASGTPIITTQWPFHAPEFEYLRPGVDSVVTRDDVGAYVEAVRDAVRAPSAARASMRDAALHSSESFSIEDMGSRFLAGIRNFLVQEGKL
jgi:glycosyltransferase involved in cell wall biosynthesis